jgi:S-adenosylmethionine-diacylglycerol 3-amino-3-carboxypropyl transferase
MPGTHEIRYAQCWEDADILLEALNIKPGAHCFSIASAGDNTLALLTQNPARVVAVDRNRAQLFCLQLRVAAYRSFEYSELLQFIGSRPSRTRATLYRRCRSELSPDARQFWDARLHMIENGIGSAGKFERYFQIFRRHVLPFVHPRSRMRQLLRDGSPRQRRDFYHQKWNSWRWRLIFHLFFSRVVMSRLGRDRSAFSQVRGSVAGRILRRVEYALAELDAAKNPYLHWILAGCHGTSLPVALREENFEIIRSRLDRLEWHCASLGEYLHDTQPRSFHAFNLSDVFEYMPENDYHCHLKMCVRAGAPGARLAYWNMLAPRRRPGAMQDVLESHDELARKLFARDQAFFYSDFVVEEVREAAL